MMGLHQLKDESVVGVLVAAVIVTPAVGDEDRTFSDDIKVLCQEYVVGFGSDHTGLVYHHRLDGPRGIDALSSPAEIVAGTVNGKPIPYGYGSGIQDVALENGQLLFALCDVFDATGDPEIADLARRIFLGICRVATVSPEPGFVPRGPHPDGRSYYRNSSRDQHAALAEALWRYGHSGLATVDDRRFIAGELDEMAGRMEANDWKIMVEDGSLVAHVGFSWKQSTPIGAISLLSFLAMVSDATGDPHWQNLYHEYSTEKDSFRWRKLLAPGAVENWKPFTLYSNQFTQALLALKRAASDPGRKSQIAELQRRLAHRALQSDVFDSIYWRRLDWAGDEADDVASSRLSALGLSLSMPRNVFDLFNAFDPSWMRADNWRLRSTGNKLCFGIPTAAFHKALVSEDPEFIDWVAPYVRRMVRTLLDHGQDYRRGENYNRTVVLALMLWAAEARSDVDAQDDSVLPAVGQLGLGPSMDLTFDNGLLHVIGKGKLHVVDVSDSDSPRVKGTISGLGHVRQVSVRNGVAYVTAREDGLFLVDVSNPEQMGILAHYDTIELATGIAVSGDVAFVACRTAGVELIDVSSPESPLHLSTVRTGEAQSVAVRDGILYAGVWGTGELVICNVSGPRRPTIIARVKLDGYGDGVDVRGNYCYVATGHHARSMPHRAPTDPGYGRGHGLEIIDISNPRTPELVGRVKFPPFYRLGMDTWDVKATDRYAFVADTYNGVFVVEITEPSKPHVVAHRTLPFIPARNDPSPSAGLALGAGTVYVAGVWSDVHFFPWVTSSTSQESDRDVPLAVFLPTEQQPDPRFRTYRLPGQVHSVDFDDVAFVACGDGGLHAIEIAAEIDPLETYPTEGFALGVATCQGRVYVAEGEGGLSIWKHTSEGRLETLGRYRVADDSVRQVVIVAGQYALLHVGPGTLHVVDVSNPGEPIRVFKDSRLGLFYYNPIARGVLGDRYACCHWHVSGLYWYDFAAGTPKWSGRRYPSRIGSRNGVAFLADKALVTCRGGYTLISHDGQPSFDDSHIRRIPGLTFHGKPTVDGDRLYLSDRNTGIVTAIDISDPDKPQYIDQLKLPEHPGQVSVNNNTPVIPAGYQGLVIWDACGDN